MTTVEKGLGARPCVCTVNLRTGDVIEKALDCPVHGTGEGFYIVNVSRGKVEGPFPYKDAKYMLDLSLAEWATRSPEYAQVRHDRMCEVTVESGPRSEEDYQKQTVIRYVNWDGPRRPHFPNKDSLLTKAEARIINFPPNQYTHLAGPRSIQPSGLSHHYAVTPMQAVLEVASALIARHERNMREYERQQQLSATREVPDDE